MPTESELRTFLQQGESGDGRGNHTINTANILRRSRRRRLPQQLAVGGAATFAVAGLSVASVQGFNLMNPASSTIAGARPAATDGASAAPGAPEVAPGGAVDNLMRAPASKLNLCGGTLADVSPGTPGALTDVAPSLTGLVLTPNFPVSSPVDGTPITGTVTMTNTGSERVVGSTGPEPVVTLSQGGIVLWHSNGPVIAMAVMVDLAPGQSMSYPASFLPVVCGVEDDSAESFRQDLPRVTAGDYQVSAAIDILLDFPVNSSPQLELVTGPLSTVTLR